MGSSAAFFDIDRTLVVGTSLESCFLRIAWRRKVVGPAALLRNLWAGLQALGLLPAHEGGRIPIPAGLPRKTRLRYAFFSGNKAYLRGLRLELGVDLAAAAFQEEILPRLSPRGQEAIAAHRAAGRTIVLLTGTLDFLGEPLRAFLRAEYMLAARPEVRDGIFTGRLAEPHPYGVHKRELLCHLAEAQGFDLAASYAYADHHTDLPFLESVGHPVAVNPDAKLSQVARQRGWELVEWRSSSTGD
jgi:HAD superfamily hydrolase (TIGR01490 family)